MTSITFDTLAAARTLRSAGLDEKTAEAIVAVVQRTTVLPTIDHLATKDQLESVEKRLLASIGDLRTLMFAMFGMNITAVLGMGAFLFTVLKHA